MNILSENKNKQDYFFSQKYEIEKAFNEFFGAVAIYSKQRIIESNEAFAKEFGFNNNEIIGVHLNDLFTLESYNQVFKNAIFGKESVFEVNCRKKDGTVFKCKISNKIENRNGKTIGYLTVRRLLENAEIEIPKKYDRYSALFEYSMDGIYICSTDGIFLEVNPSFINMLGFDNPQELISRKVPPQLMIKNDNSNESNLKHNSIFETIIRKKDGSEIVIEVSNCYIYDKTEMRYILGIVRDITSRKKNEEKIRFLSFHDSLTGLYNRLFFEEELKRLDQERNLPISVIIGDISGLKLVNDTFGHNEGDKIIISCADILRNCCRKDDIIARMGGDEFSILLPKTNEEEVEKIIERIKENSQKITNTKISLNIALGYSCKYSFDQDFRRIIKEAEDNMYTNKLAESRTVSDSIFSSLKRMLYEKSIETELHADRMRDMAIKLGQALKLPKRKIDELVLLSSLHDIGKITVSDDILKKKGKLTKQEWDIIKKHPVTGYKIVLTCSQFSPISKGILYHHENWDGSGYPEGLSGENIPITSRIVSIVDAYDVMTNGRPYKKPMTKKEAIDELKRCSGKQFDPKIVDIFISIL